MLWSKRFANWIYTNCGLNLVHNPEILDSFERALPFFCSASSLLPGGRAGDEPTPSRAIRRRGQAQRRAAGSACSAQPELSDPERVGRR
jgi:hypothetical protein